MYKGLDLHFTYAICFSKGIYYTGKSGQSFAGKREEAYTYTEKGAYAKIDRMAKVSDYWKNATVEEVL